VCEIAFQEMNDKARREVRRLIALDPEFRVFSDACTWADYPLKRAPEHFITVRRDFTTFISQDCPTTPVCTFTGIRRDFHTLQTSTDDPAKLEALKFLGHWIGDLHQPLHVSFEDDRGGGKIKESGPCTNNLHAVWDSCIIERELGTNPRNVAKELLQEISDADRARWMAVSIEGWATESLAIARRADVLYCLQVAGRCMYARGREVYVEGTPETTVLVEAAYLEAQRTVVSDRLKQAGVRLGALLNLALGQP